MERVDSEPGDGNFQPAGKREFLQDLLAMKKAQQEWRK
jgi:hypothetical protein